MGSFQIDIIGAICLVFSLNDGIIIHHMMTLMNYLMMVGLTELSDDGIFESDHSLDRITE